MRWFNSGRGHPSIHDGFRHRAGVSDRAFVSAVVRSRPPKTAGEGGGLAHDWRTEEAEPAPTTRGQMGHSSITITLDRYGHLMPEDEAAELLEVYHGEAGAESH